MCDHLNNQYYNALVLAKENELFLCKVNVSSNDWVGGLYLSNSAHAFSLEMPECLNKIESLLSYILRRAIVIIFFFRKCNSEESQTNRQEKKSIKMLRYILWNKVCVIAVCTKPWTELMDFFCTIRPWLNMQIKSIAKTWVFPSITEPAFLILCWELLCC